MTRLKKTLLISSITIVSLVALIIIFISPIAKYLVEKNDVKWLGRQITLDWSYVNPFTGAIHLRNVKIYENKSDSVFFSAKGIGGNFSMHKLFSKNFELTKLTLDHPRAVISKTKEGMNFDDLIERFKPKEPKKPKQPVKFSISGIELIAGEFHYREEQIPINYFIKNVNIGSSGKQWDADTIAASFSLESGTSTGTIKGDVTINFKTQDYRAAVVVNKFDLDIINQYLKDLSNFGSLRATLDADVKSSGNFNDQEDLTASGQVTINEFHFGKNSEEDYLSFDKLDIAIIQVSPKEHIYNIDSISLVHPYFKYEKYDSLDNLQNMFGAKGSKVKAAASGDDFNLIIEIARYVKVLGKNFIRSEYEIGRVAIYKGDIKFNDFSTTEKFAIELNPLTVEADSISKKHDRVELVLRSGIKPYGNLSIAISMNPSDSSDFDLNYNFRKLPISMFNPYVISFTSYPLDRGTLELKGVWNVRNGEIRSSNHLTIIDPRVGKRIKNKDTNWIPTPLIMSIVRENGNVIDYEIPITGNLKDPKFNIWDVVGDVVENIFVKPVTSPYRAQVKNIETEIEKSLTFKWKMRSAVLLPSQGKFIEKMADFLKKNPEESISVHPHQYTLKEKEYTLFFEAKKKYFLLMNKKDTKTLSEEDSLAVDKMSVKDKQFVNYLDKHLNDSMLFTIQQKCALYVDASFINAKLKHLNAARENAFMAYFKEKEVEKRIKISPVEKIIPYNGFSYYKIDYKGDLPEFLKKAYQQMNDLDDEPPRKKFRKERNKNKDTLTK